MQNRACKTLDFQNYGEHHILRELCYQSDIEPALLLAVTTNRARQASLPSIFQKTLESAVAQPKYLFTNGCYRSLDADNDNAALHDPTRATASLTARPKRRFALGLRPGQTQQQLVPFTRCCFTNLHTSSQVIQTKFSADQSR